eukprot:gene18008-11906_t
MAGYSTIVAPAGGAGVVVKRNCTLWELPSWICAGTVLSIAPEPTSETAMGFAVHPAVASSIGWEETSRPMMVAELGARYTMSADGTTLRLNLDLGRAANGTATGGTLPLSSSFFEIKGVLRASTAAMWSAGAVVTSTGYSATTLTQTVTIAIAGVGRGAAKAASMALCINVAAEVAAPAGGCVVHKLKALLDGELHNPQQVAMPLVASVNSATRPDAACKRGDGKAAQAELENFDASLSAALTTLVSSNLVGQSKLSTAVLLFAEACAFKLAGQRNMSAKQVEANRTFVLPNVKGKADLRTRLIEVFQSADTHGVPNGKLDIRELQHRLNLADFRAAVEGLDAVVDANGDGHITLSEIAEAMDGDGDGTITLTEFQSVSGGVHIQSRAYKVFAEKLAREEAAAPTGDPNVNLIFDAMNANGDGNVTKHEFVDWLNVHKPKRGPWSKLPVLLKAFDLTKKANITKADFQTAFAKAKGLEVALFQFEGANFDSKVEVCTKFSQGLQDGSAAGYASEDCTFNPPGAPVMPVGAMLGMMQPFFKAFPDWHSV